MFLNGQGAEAFARERNFELVSNEYFFTTERHGEWMKKRNPGEHTEGNPSPSEASFGTVGAVALDVHGNLASAASTPHQYLDGPRHRAYCPAHSTAFIKMAN